MHIHLQLFEHQGFLAFEMPPRCKRPWVSVARLSKVMAKFLREDWKEGTERVPLFADEHTMPQLCVRALELNFELLLPIFTAFPHAAPTLSCIRDSWVEATQNCVEATASDINEEAIRIHDLWAYTFELARRTKTWHSKSVRASRLKSAIWGNRPDAGSTSPGDRDSSGRASTATQASLSGDRDSSISAVSASGSVAPEESEDAGAVDEGEDDWPC